MTQIKFFENNDCNASLEKSVNAFLNENKGKIKVCDIKFTPSILPQDLGKIITAIVIYETID